VGRSGYRHVTPGGDAPRAGALLEWFRAHRRPLPWRRDRDPYRVWVAEVLLQQTRVAQAVGYYERFLARFPNVRTLAAASEEEVLKVWEGAGYYARARHLWAAARQIVVERRGEFPVTASEWRQLPGVGPYIAAAVASLAGGSDDLALEANGLRVGARLALITDDVRRPATRARVTRFLEGLKPTGPSGSFNEAIMELGEIVCRPRAPRCPECPWGSVCRARRELPDPGTVPRRASRGPAREVHGAVVAVRRGRRLLVQRRPSNGLLGGLWELPGGQIERGESPEGAARRELTEETGLTAVGPLRAAGVVAHSYTHFRVRLHVFVVDDVAGRLKRGATPHRRWMTPTAFARLPRPKATEKAMRRVEALLHGEQLAGVQDPVRIARPLERSQQF
jgi:A/G-specific adenine glycosylase